MARSGRDEPRKLDPEKTEGGLPMWDRSGRIRKLIDRGLMSTAEEIPTRAIPVDPDCSTKAGTWSPEVYYEDIDFQCAACGRTERWTAQSQLQYFEVVHASPHKRPKHCYDCRQAEVVRKAQARRDAGHTRD